MIVSQLKRKYTFLRGIEVTVTLLGTNLKKKKTLQKSPSQQWDGQHENRMPPVIAVTGVEAYKH